MDWLTLAAYVGISAAVGWWFYRSQDIGARWHVVVSIVFGLLWPVSMLWLSVLRLAGRLRRRRIVREPERERTL